MPTGSFQLHKIINLKVNNRGVIGILFNPNFLYNSNLVNKKNTPQSDTLFYDNNNNSYTYEQLINNNYKNYGEELYAINYLTS